MDSNGPMVPMTHDEHELNNFLIFIETNKHLLCCGLEIVVSDVAHFFGGKW